jgi:hypothetical protein
MDMKVMAAQMVDATRSFVRRALDPITQRVSALETRVGALAMMRGTPGGRDEQSLSKLQSLEARLKALEERPQMHYAGVWKEGFEHKPGELCTHDGSMWYCWRPTTSRPGTDEAWQLCVKHGRDRR